MVSSLLNTCTLSQAGPRRNRILSVLGGLCQPGPPMWARTARYCSNWCHCLDGLDPASARPLLGPRRLGRESAPHVLRPYGPYCPYRPYSAAVAEMWLSRKLKASQRTCRAGSVGVGALSATLISPRAGFGRGPTPSCARRREETGTRPNHT